MSRTIDSRVVEMQFDNRRFESNVKTSMSTLEKLKQSLNLTGASKGLENISAAAKNVNFSGLSGAVENVRLKFSAFEVMAVTALTNITNLAINTGIQLIKSLSIDQVIAGWTKYEQKIDYIQTIMNATGKSVDEVNAYLDELMWFSDETSYSFTDMTAALAQMTSSGGDIDNLIPLITGIANATAYAGKGAAEFSRAIYNLNQSYGMGSLQYMDWKSLELAGVASKQLKQIFIDTGVAMGKIKEGEVTIANFSSTLKDKWADTSVMEAAFGKFAELSKEAYKLVKSGEYDTASEAMEALSGKYSDVAEKAFKSAQQAKTFKEAIEATKDAVSTGWMKTMEIIFGDIEEAIELWTGLTNVLWDVFASGAEARNEMLQGWKELGGRTALIESFSNAFEALRKIVTPIKEAFRDIFPAMTSERLYALTEGLKSFTERLQIGDDTADKIKRTFKGLFAVLDLIKDAFGFIFDVAGHVFGLFRGPAAGGILELTARFGDFLVKLHDTAEAGNIFGKAFEKVKEIFTTVADKIKDAIDRIGTAFQGFKSIDMSPLFEFSEKAGKRLRPFTRLGEIFGAVFEIIVQVLEWAVPIVAKLGSIVGKTLGSLADKIGQAVEKLEFNEILDLINAGLFGVLLYRIKDFIKSLTGVSDSVTGIFKGIKSPLKGINKVLNSVCDSLKVYQTTLKAKTLLSIATAIGILAAALLVLSLIDSEKLTSSLMGITVLFVELSTAMSVIAKTMGNVKMAKISGQMIAMATAILILSFAMENLASLDWEGVAKGTVGIAVLTTALVVAAKTLNKSSGKLIKGSTGLITFATAILIMSKAVESMSELSWEELAKGLTGLTVILAELVAVTRLMGKPKRMISMGVGMIALGAAMLIFAEAVEKMGQLSWSEIGKGLTTMAGALTAITIAMKFLPKGMINKATGMVIMGAALLIIGEAVEKMGSLSWGEIAKGLATLAGSLAAITLALNFMPKGMITKATGLIGVATALTILVKPLREMSSMSWEEIGKGLATLAGSMTILAVALKVMRKAIPGAAAMMIVAPALVIMAGALKILGSMSLSEIGMGLLALAGTFTVLGTAALILKPLVPTIIGLSAAIALLGVGVMAVGVGVLAFATGLATLSVSATAAAGAITIIGSAILSLIPILFEKIGEGLIALGNVIINGAPIIKDAFLVLLASALEAITEATPMIAEAALTLVTSLLDALIKYTPGIVERIFDFLIGILDAIAAKLPQLIKAAIDVLMAFFSGIVDALSGIDVEVLLAGIAGVGLLSAIIFALAAVVPFIPGAMAGVVGIGVVIAELALILAAIGALAQLPGLKWLIDEGAELMKGIGNAIGSFVGGIVGGFMSGVSSNFPKIGSDLSEFMTNIQPFIEGARKIDASTMDGVKALSEVILILTASNILDSLTSWFTGGNSLSKFADELVPFGRAMKAFSDEVSGIKAETVSNAAIAGKTLAEMAATLPNTGGVVGFFAGENDMETFGKQLVPFGRAMKAFANEVTGLDASVVTEAATAGKALAEMADTVPNSGGVVGFFAGENDIEAFGKQLIPFGKAMKEFSLSVSGLRADVIQNSVTAGQALMELADTVPNTGGVVSWFTGNNDLDIFGEQLVPFGKAMKDYSMAVTGLNSNVVVNSANAAKALVELSNNLPNTGGIVSWFTGDNDIATFGKQLVSFGQSFAAYYESIRSVNTAKLSGVVREFKNLVDLANGIKNVDTSGMSTFSKDLASLGNAGIDSFINAFTNANSRVTAAASTMLTTFINAANSKRTELITTFTNLIQTAITIIKNKYYEFKIAGQSTMIRFIDGVKTKESSVLNAFIQIVMEALTAIKNKYHVFFNTGKYLVQGFAAGITENTYLAEAKAQAMAAAAIQAAEKELGIHSPSKEFMYLGEHIGEGMAIGIDNSITKATNSSSKLANEIIENSKKSIEEFQAWVDEKKYYNEISLKEELDAWTLVQQRYIEGTEERKKADKEVYRLQKELVKATYQYSVNWIEREKYYNRLSLKEELEAWQRIQNRYMEGSEERKKADREVYRLQKELTDKKIELEKEYADTVKSINDDLKRDIQSLNDDYENALKSRADTIYRSYRLFDEVSAPEHVSSDELIKNLNSQVESLKTWRDTLDNLVSRGLDPKLIEELREMGPSALGELTAISKMTDEQLSKYSDLWREKHRLAKIQATAELEEMRIETDRKIEQLKIEADAKLAEYIETWKTRMAELTDVVVLPTDANIVMSTNDVMNNSIEAINSKQAEYNSAGKNVVSNLIAGIKSKDKATSKAFIQSISNCLTKIKNKYNDFFNIGKYLVQGFAAGITMYTFLAEARARAMASAAAKAAEKVLGIHSPSKVGFGIGNYFGLGFVNALSAYVSKSYQAGSEIAKSAKNGLSEAISKITDVIEEDIDTQPTIRPVLDLSDVERGTGRLNALFSSTQAMSIGADMSHIGRNVSGTGEKIQNGGNVYSFVQNNYSPKALSRLEIYRQTKNQFSMLKGLVEA